MRCFFPITRIKGKKIRQRGRGKWIKKERFYILTDPVFSSAGDAFCGSGQWEGRPERERTTLLRGKQLRFQKLNVKVERGLDADKKFFCFLYLP